MMWPLLFLKTASKLIPMFYCPYCGHSHVIRVLFPHTHTRWACEEISFQLGFAYLPEINEERTFQPSGDTFP